MFGGFEATVDAQAKKRWLASTGTSLAIYGVIGVVVAIIASHTIMERHQEDQVDVTFRAAAEPEPAAAKNEPPPPDTAQMLMETSRSQQRMNDWTSMIAGTLPVREFFQAVA